LKKQAATIEIRQSPLALNDQRLKAAISFAQAANSAARYEFAGSLYASFFTDREKIAWGKE
jgi:hypothetical protein